MISVEAEMNHYRPLIPFVPFVPYYFRSPDPQSNICI